MPKTAKRLRVTVQRMARHGEGIAMSPAEPLVFVPGVLPGETADVAVTERRRHYSRATVERLRNLSPERVSPPCPIYGQCGGCVFQHWVYSAELAYKANRVEESLARIGGFTHPPLEPIRGAPHPYEYRAKGSFPWAGETGHLVLGLYARASHRVVETSRCLIQRPLINDVLKAAPEAANRLLLDAYQEGSHTGLLRHLVVRSSRLERQTAALIVVRAPDPRLSAWATLLMASVPHLRGVAANLNPLRTNRILGPSTWTLAGDPHLTEEILGARFRLAPDAFFQVNPEQVAVLYALALDCVGADPFAVGFDLYAGVGALAILLSRKVTAVHAVEALPAAVTEGRSNAQRNRAPVTFHEGLAEIVVPELVSRGVIPDVIVLDPPRSGVRPEVLEAIVQSGARRLVYISCEPETMARDLARLSHRYRLERVIPVDLFPRTDHVETVCRLSLNLVPPVPQPISQCNHHDEPDSHDEPNAL